MSLNKKDTMKISLKTATKNTLKWLKYDAFNGYVALIERQKYALAQEAILYLGHSIHITNSKKNESIYVTFRDKEKRLCQAKIAPDICLSKLGINKTKKNVLLHVIYDVSKFKGSFIIPEESTDNIGEILINPSSSEEI